MSERRNVWLAMRRGFMCRCPNCGKGRLFNRFLKVSPSCEVCGENYHHHRADDLPAYLSIVVVGHVVVFGLLHFALSGEEVSPLTDLLILVPVSIGLALAVIQPIKARS